MSSTDNMTVTEVELQIKKKTVGLVSCVVVVVVDKALNDREHDPFMEEFTARKLARRFNPDIDRDVRTTLSSEYPHASHSVSYKIAPAT